jgi:hypothetical protein
MLWLRVFKHVLPNAKAWRITIDKTLRQFFEGLSGLPSDVREYFDLLWFDILPDTTRELRAWEIQFALRNTGLTEQERRDRLDATWKALGGQDPRYIQDTLRANGFDVYVHEWWVPGTEPAVGVKACVTPRNPLLYLRRGSSDPVYIVECGEAVMECGEALAECGESLEPSGYPLVNKVFETIPNVRTLCGEAIAECGEVEMECGNFTTFQEVPREYVIPLDSDTWPYFLYIGGQTFGDLATVDPKRKDEFEELCLKICPCQQWLGMLITYI